MFIARWMELVLVGLYQLSPYRWLDLALEVVERRRRSRGQEAAAGRVRQLRYFWSECYILGWLLLALSLIPWAAQLPVWATVLGLIRVFGILQKELGVILFGRCKITKGAMVAASGRTILLALLNYLSAALLFVPAYSQGVAFILADGGPAPLSGSSALFQSLSIAFSLGPAYAPVDGLGTALVTGQMAFCFLFGVIVISLFISLLNFGAEKR